MASHSQILKKRIGHLLCNLSLPSNIFPVSIWLGKCILKTTLENIVSELIANNIISEYVDLYKTSDSSLLRPPITLDISPHSPLIAGILVKRNILTVIFTDFKGVIMDQINYEYVTLDHKQFIHQSISMYEQLSSR